MLEPESGVSEEVVEEIESTEQEVEQVEEIEEITVTDSEPRAEESEEEETPAIRKVREAHREEQRKRKELERRLADLEAKAKPKEEPAPEVGPEPQLADYDFDGEEYGKALKSWMGRQQAKAAWEAKQRAREEEVVRQQQTVLENYRKAADALPVDKAKFKEAETVVVNSLSPVVQTAILDGFDPKDQATLVYVLGAFPSKLEQVQGVESPVKLGKVLGDILRGVSITKRPKDVPPPEKVITRSGGAAESLTKKLDELANAGDFKAYRELKKKLQAKAKA